MAAPSEPHRASAPKASRGASRGFAAGKSRDPILVNISPIFQRINALFSIKIGIGSSAVDESRNYAAAFSYP
jgi:hypothetical protein